LLDTGSAFDQNDAEVSPLTFSRRGALSANGDFLKVAILVEKPDRSGAVVGGVDVSPVGLTVNAYFEPDAGWRAGVKVEAE
jgi:hypothetical protein